MRSLLVLLLAATPARPQVTVQVPTALKLEREGKKLSVSIGAAREGVRVAPTAGLVLGVHSREVVWPSGEARPAWMREGLAGADDFNLGTSIYEVGPGPQDVEVELELFETDVPPGHHWLPQSGKYRVLWTRRLSATAAVSAPAP